MKKEKKEKKICISTGKYFHFCFTSDVFSEGFKKLFKKASE